jgi:hypothetical protein
MLRAHIAEQDVWVLGGDVPALVKSEQPLYPSAASASQARTLRSRLRDCSEVRRQKPLKLQKEVLRQARCDEYGVAARVTRTLDVGRVRVAGQRDNRRPVCVGTVSEQSAQVVPINVGETDVKEDGVRWGLRHLLECVMPVGRCRGFDAGVLQAQAQHLSSVGVVFHDEHEWRALRVKAAATSMAVISSARYTIKTPVPLSRS